MRGWFFGAAMTPMLALVLSRPFAGVLLWCWISFMNPHRLVWGPAAEVPWALLVFAGTVVGLALSREPKRLPMDANNVLVMVFLVCITATSLVAEAPAEAVEAKWELVFKGFLFLLVISATLTSRRRVDAVVWVIVLSLGYYGVRGGAFALLTAGAYRVFGPAGTVIGDNNHLAAAMLVAIPLMNYLRLHARHRVVRLGLAGSMGLMLMTVLASYSRGALIGLAAAALALWWNSSRKLVGGVAMAVCILGAVAVMPDQWSSRMSTIESYHEDDSANERFAIWQASAAMALARPLTGAGFMAAYTPSVIRAFAPDATARAVHSIWLEVLGEHGFPTFFVWVGLSVTGCATTLRITRRTRNRPELRWAYDFAKMVQVSIVAYLTAGTFLSLCYWDVYFTVLVALAAVGRQVALAPQPDRVRLPRVALARPVLAGSAARG